ncbi:MAG: hypothetical protein IRZ18_08320 [Clostridia bacterium]|nr:hypothetical protein [Clostridia bacterium]
MADAQTGAGAGTRPRPSPASRRVTQTAARPAARASAAGLPRRLLEIDVFAGRLEITERYGDGAAEALARALDALGLPTERVFQSPCG